MRTPERNVADDRLLPAMQGWRAQGVTGERRRYPSDLTERQWRSVEQLLGNVASRRPGLTAPLRDVADAINYRWRTGCSWRMLPHDFPPWSTVYTHFRRWREHGMLSDIRAAVLTTRRGMCGSPVAAASGTLGTESDLR